MDEPLEEELRPPGQAVAQPGVHGVGGGVALVGVQPHHRLALAAGLLLAEGHELPGLAPARPPGGDDQGVDDGHPVPVRRELPGDGVVLGELDAVEDGGAVDLPALLRRPQGARLQGPPGGVQGGVLPPHPVGVGGGAGVLGGQDLLVDVRDGGQVGGNGRSDHGKGSFSCGSAPIWAGRRELDCLRPSRGGDRAVSVFQNRWAQPDRNHTGASQVSRYTSRLRVDREV